MIKNLLLAACLLPMYANGQSLLNMLEQDEAANTEIQYVEGTFKSTRLINGQTSEITAKKELNFIISHRFGELKSGAYNLFGLDQSVMRLGLEYGICNGLAFGLGRGNFQKIFDSYFKYQVLKQSKGALIMPVTLTLYSACALNSEKWAFPERANLFSSRLFYVHQIIVARKFNTRFSAQALGGIVHRNLVATRNDQNNVPFLGVGGRMLITNRFAFTTEYFYLLPGETSKKFNNSLSLGVDIDTGGHIFQLHVSNSSGMTEKSFVPETQNSWEKAEIHFGFNIIRNFAFYAD